MTAKATTTTKKKILIVEDEAMLNDAYAIILSKEGYDVMQSFDGQGAIDQLASFAPDLILLDLRMPRMDGLAFLAKVAPATNLPKTKIIIFSNYDEQSEIDKAYELGAHRYMLKAWAAPKELVRFVAETIAS
jgi:DNA-binding NarL/FixJ family response regulator